MRRFLIPLIALFAATPAAAQQRQAFHSADAGYTVQLPATWTPMSDADVELMRQAGAVAGMPFTIEAGFRVTDSPDRLPFIMVAWMDLGEAVTPEEFGAMVTTAHEQEQSRQGAPEPGLAHIDALTWDAENRTVWSRAAMPESGEAGPFTWTATTLHPDGTTTVVFSYRAVPGEDEARIRADLLQVVRSLRAD